MCVALTILPSFSRKIGPRWPMKYRCFHYKLIVLGYSLRNVKAWKRWGKFKRKHLCMHACICGHFSSRCACVCLCVSVCNISTGLHISARTLHATLRQIPCRRSQRALTLRQILVTYTHQNVHTHTHTHTHTDTTQDTPSGTKTLVVPLYASPLARGEQFPFDSWSSGKFVVNVHGD